MKKKQLKKWQVTVGKRIWLFYGVEKPMVTELKEDKIRGRYFSMVFVDEAITK